jgi:hypothetical protein
MIARVEVLNPARAIAVRGAGLAFKAPFRLGENTLTAGRLFHPL